MAQTRKVLREIREDMIGRLRENAAGSGVVGVFAGQGRHPIRDCLHPYWVKTPSRPPSIPTSHATPADRAQNRDAVIIWLNLRQHGGNSLQTKATVRVRLARLSIDAGGDRLCHCKPSGAWIPRPVAQHKVS